MSNHYQLAVIGSGAGGREATLLAARKGLRTALIERDKIGGTSFHRGCYAVCALKACARQFRDSWKSGRFGSKIHLLKATLYDWMIAQKEVSSRLADKFQAELRQLNVDVHQGHGEFLDNRTLQVIGARGFKKTITDNLVEKSKLDMNEVIDSPAASGDSLDQPKSPFRLSHILVPTDFSPSSENAMNHAIELAKLARAKLTLLHVVPEPSALDYTMGGIPVDEIQGWQKEATVKLTEQLARAKLEYQDVESVQTTALHPRDEIVRAAAQLSADLLVLSTHGYTGWKHALFGSDAEKILEHAPCPTLVIR